VTACSSSQQTSSNIAQRKRDNIPQVTINSLINSVGF
jgi:hypothetical protein